MIVAGPSENSSGKNNQSEMSVDISRSSEASFSPPPYLIPQDRQERSRLRNRHGKASPLSLAMAACCLISLVAWIFVMVHLNVVYRAEDIPETLYPHADDGDVLSCDLGWTRHGKIERASQDGPFAGMDSKQWHVEEPLDPTTWHSGYFSAETRLHLPESDSLFFLARGLVSRGTIRFTTVASDEPTPITVDMKVSYWSSLSLDSKMTMCMLKRGERHHGLGIFTSQLPVDRSQDLDYALSYEIVVTLPVPTNSYTRMGQLTTDLSNFNHILDLGGHISFDGVSIRAPDGKIQLESLLASNLAIKAANLPVQGTISVEKSAAILNENAPIEVRINATSSDWLTPANITLRTSNNHVRAEIQPHTTEDEWTARLPSLNILAATTNGQLDVNVPTAPLGAHIHLNVSTTNANSIVRLPHNFTGVFRMRSDRTSRIYPSPETPGFHRKIETKLQPDGTLSGAVWLNSRRELAASTLHIDTQNGYNIAKFQKEYPMG